MGAALLVNTALEYGRTWGCGMTAIAKSIDSNRHAPAPQLGAASLSIRVLVPLLTYVATRGHDSSAFLRDNGIDPVLLRDPEARLPQAVATHIWHSAGQLTQDSNLGIHVAESIRPGAFGVLGYALSTSETLRMSLQRLCRYQRFLHDAAEVKLTVQADRAILSHYLAIPGGPPRQVSEYVLAGWLVTSRQATGVNWSPLEVRFPHSAPDDSSELRRFFACTLKFENARSELVFSRELLNRPLLKADPNLQAILEGQVVAMIEKLPKGEAATDAVRRYVVGELCNGEPTLEEIAPRLHMSPRTLHRRLDEEGTSFRRVLTEVRRELATRHLTERQIAISEIAFLLGFSEPSAFHRAFKRWTGYAPIVYRERAFGSKRARANVAE